MENQNDLFEVLDKQTKVLVGILMKRVEVLEKNKVLTPQLYKDLSKEVIYEWSRALRTILEIGKVNFIPTKQEKSV